MTPHYYVGKEWGFQNTSRYFKIKKSLFRYGGGRFCYLFETEGHGKDADPDDAVGQSNYGLERHGAVGVHRAEGRDKLQAAWATPHAALSSGVDVDLMR